MKLWKADCLSLRSLSCGLLSACGYAVALIYPALAQAEAERGTFSALFENDYFFHTDRDYTNGVEFAWTTAPGLALSFANGKATTPAGRWLSFRTAKSLASV